MLICVSEGSESNQSACVLVIDKVFFEVHLVNEKANALLPLLQLPVFGYSQMLCVDL